MDARITPERAPSKATGSFLPPHLSHHFMQATKLKLLLILNWTSSDYYFFFSSDFNEANVRWYHLANLMCMSKKRSSVSSAECQARR